jgi:DNA-binding HxlR family transcriptional regulator
MTRLTPGPILPAVPFKACPVRATLGILGRKWALLVIRDIGLRRLSRFNELVKANPGMTPRALSLLLRDLQLEGLALRTEASRSSKDGIRYSLTKKGRDALPVVTALIEFGMQHYANQVFDDGRARDLAVVFPGAQEVMLGPLLRFASRAGRDKPP